MGRWSLHGLGKLEVACKHSKVTVQLFEGSVICPETKPPGLPCSQRLRVSKGRAEDVTVRSIWESLVSLGCRNSVVTSAKEINILDGGPILLTTICDIAQDVDS